MLVDIYFYLLHGSVYDSHNIHYISSNFEVYIPVGIAR